MLIASALASLASAQAALSLGEAEVPEGQETHSPIEMPGQVTLSRQEPA
jgi:hypothetical protein